LFLIFGLASRYQAISVLLLTLGSLPYYFSGSIDVDLMGQNTGNGLIFYVPLFISCIIIITKGGGKFSTDSFLIRVFDIKSTRQKKI
tara:strand:- start:149492 stop:149752 length:261 start_codon:yes stop_codon:yes gene_type:complete